MVPKFLIYSILLSNCIFFLPSQLLILTFNPFPECVVWAVPAIISWSCFVFCECLFLPFLLLHHVISSLISWEIIQIFFFYVFFYFLYCFQIPWLLFSVYQFWSPAFVLEAISRVLRSLSICSCRQSQTGCSLSMMVRELKTWLCF